MSRLARFEQHRFVGTRHDMKVYDCDDADQFSTLQGLVESDDLLGRNLLQAFGPDTIEEARNRGFRPVG